MAVGSTPTDFFDLARSLARRVTEADAHISADQAKEYINIALYDMHIGFREKMSWAERNAILVTQPKYTTGTVAISQGNTALTGTSTAWATANAFGITNARAGGKIVIDGGSEVYEVSAVGSDTSITLTSAFVKDDVTAATYEYFEDEYALHADFLRPVDYQNFDTAGDIDLIGRNEFRFRYPRNKTTGKPRVATIVDKAFSGSTTAVRKVRFWQPPDAAYSIPYSFVTNKLAISSTGTAQANLLADTDEPIVPLHARHVIVLHGLYNFYRDKLDVQRSQQAKAEYTDLMLRIVGDQEIGRSRPQFRPRRGVYLSRAQKPYRGRSGRYTTGDSFDQLRDR